MAAFDFPNSPSVNDQHTDNGITFKWDGTVWKRVSATGAQGPTGSTGSQGATGPTCLLYTSPSPRDLSTSRMPSSA